MGQSTVSAPKPGSPPRAVFVFARDGVEKAHSLPYSSSATRTGLRLHGGAPGTRVFAFARAGVEGRRPVLLSIFMNIHGPKVLSA